MRLITVLCLGWIMLSPLQGAPYEVIEDTSTLKILTPDLQGIKTLKIRLANDLEALLISHPGAHESCAALSVGAGSWDDPENYPGMAHFLEHMLFMGTKPYPHESEYKQFISDHGGSMNAYTACNQTVYGFSIQHPFLLEGLKRFSRFFIDPLLRQESVNRELIAVDQEHAKNIENDAWRSYMILKETANPLHPHIKFSTGNKETLSGIPREALEKWYHENYSANQMHLVVISPLTLSELRDEVVANFSPIVNIHLKQKQFPTSLFSDQQKGHFLYIEPVKDQKELSLIWQIPPTIAKDQTSHIPSIFARVLSYQGTHSLFQALKQEALIQDFHISIDHLNVDCAVLSLDFSLTEEGVKNKEVIIQKTFTALAFLQESGLPKTLFDEYYQKHILDYTYQSQEDAFSFAMKIAGELTYEPLSSYPERSTLPLNYQPEQMQKLIESLSPHSCIYMVMAPSTVTHIKPASQEKWMRASYALIPVPSDTLIKWSQVKPSPDFKLPPPNPYFPASLDLLPLTTQESPTLIMNTEGGRVYALQDLNYLLPQTSVILHIRTPFLDGSSLSQVTASLHQLALLYALEETLDMAVKAGLHVQLSHDNFKYMLTIYGYSEKLPLLCHKVFQTLKNPALTPKQFNVMKEHILASYQNSFKELPIRQALYALNPLLLTPYPSMMSKIEVLQNLSYEEGVKALKTLFDACYVEGMIYGNISQEGGKAIIEDYTKEMNSSSFPLPLHPHYQLRTPSRAPLISFIPTDVRGYGALLSLDEGPFSFTNQAIQCILSTALQDDFFDTLRSKQQTGYIASSWGIELQHHLFQLFAVQSSTHTPQELLYRFELFLEDFKRELKQKISLDRFMTLKKTVEEQLRLPPLTLFLKAEELHTLAFKREGDFAFRQKQIQALEELSYEAFLSKVDDDLSRKNFKRVAVLAQGLTSQEEALHYHILTEESSLEDVFTPITSVAKEER
ncbi:MAG: insulinase family protein [Candidatus Rhabdochlamydia sp.]